MRHRGTLGFLCLLALCPVAVSQAGDPMAAAGQIETALGGKRLDQALILWEQNEEGILGNLGACLKAGSAWVSFAGLKEVLRYEDLPDECLERAVACFDAAEKALIDEDHANRILVARGLLKAGDIYIEVGVGDKASVLQDRAQAMLEALAALEAPPAGVHADLGSLYGRLAKREPPKAEEHIAQAAAEYEAERKASGDSSYLSRCVGETRQLLAETREELLAKNPKDKALAKSAAEAWIQALASFEQALKGDAKNQELKTLYNECLWEVLRVTEGKAKQKPLMTEHNARYSSLKLKLPSSALWTIDPEAEFKDDDKLFSAWKYSEKLGQALIIILSRYKWSTNYRFEETGEVMGGDNIGGLSRLSERNTKAYFQNVKDRTPLRPMPLSRKIPKAEMFKVTGLTEKNNTLECRFYFFKDSGRQATFEVMVVADLGTLDRNPYELDAILDTLEVIPRK